jgi:hypothetical protein
MAWEAICFDARDLAFMAHKWPRPAGAGARQGENGGSLASPSSSNTLPRCTNAIPTSNPAPGNIK